MAKVSRDNFPVFNSPFELGIRMVYILSAIDPRRADLQKLVLLDYAVIYSGDLNGPQSLHTPIPFRANEMLSRRSLIAQGLYLMSARGLVSAVMDERGIEYLSGPAARSLVGSLSSRYFELLEERCRWAVQKFAELDSFTLTERFNELGHRWGAELEAMYGGAS